MFCPNCGSKNSTNQKFCRSCGLGLEKTAQSLVEQFPAKLDESLESRRNKIERLGVAALISFGLGLLGLLFYIMWADGKVLAGVALITLFIFGILAVFFFNYANSLKENAMKGRLRHPEELQQG